MISPKPKHLNWSDIKLIGNSSKLNIPNAFKPVIDLCENLYAALSTVDSPYLLVFLLISVSSLIDISFWHKGNLPNRSFLRLSNSVCPSFTFLKLNKALNGRANCKKLFIQFERPCWVLWDGDNVNQSTYAIDKNLMLPMFLSKPLAVIPDLGSCWSSLWAWIRWLYFLKTPSTAVSKPCHLVLTSLFTNLITCLLSFGRFSNSFNFYCFF